MSYQINLIKKHSLCSFELLSCRSIGTPLLHRVGRRKRLNCLALTYASLEGGLDRARNAEGRYGGNETKGESVGERGNWTCARHPPIIPIRDRDVIASGWGTPNGWTRLSPSARSQNRQGRVRNDSCPDHNSGPFLSSHDCVASRGIWN